MKDVLEFVGTVIPTFDQWYELYPRKQGRAAAEKSWNKLTDQEKFECIQGTAMHVEENTQWRQKQFIPMPATFLNQKRWRDEIIKDRAEEIKSTPTNDPSEFVWAAMTQFFGEKWIKQHGDRPSEIWRKMCRDTPMERLKRGLRKTYESGNDFPPSLPKFMEYSARTFGEEIDERNAWEQERYAALPAPVVDPVTAEDAFAQMFKILGVTRNE